MPADAPTLSLRSILLLDAASCVASGLPMAAASRVLASATDIPAALLVPAGLALLPIAAFITFVALRPSSWPGAVWLIVMGNIGWVLASLWLAAGGVIAPNALGTAFIVAQAVVVAALAWLEAAMVRRLATPAAPA
jgi:hypothetical protein